MTAIAKRQPIVVVPEECKPFASGKGIEVVLKCKGLGAATALAGPRGTKAAIAYAQGILHASSKDLAVEARSSQPTNGNLGGAAIADAMNRAADPDAADERLSDPNSWWWHSFKVRDVSAE